MSRNSQTHFLPHATRSTLQRLQYWEHLSLAAPYHAIALWNLSPPGDIYDKVSIGDVHVQVQCDASMEPSVGAGGPQSDANLGKLDPCRSLDYGLFSNTTKHFFGDVGHYSRHVSVETIPDTYE